MHSSSGKFTTSKSVLSNFAAKVPVEQAVSTNSMCCNSETVPVQMAIFFHVYLKTCGLPFTLFWFILRKENLRMAAIEIYFKNRNKVSASLPFKNSLYPVLCLLNPCLSVWHPFITRPSGLPVFSIFFMFWHLWPHQWKRLPTNSWK